MFVHVSWIFLSGNENKVFHILLKLVSKLGLNYDIFLQAWTMVVAECMANSYSHLLQEMTKTVYK